MMAITLARTGRSMKNLDMRIFALRISRAAHGGLYRHRRQSVTLAGSLRPREPLRWASRY